MKKKNLIFSLGFLSIISLSLNSMAGSPSILFTLDGKKITSVPVDKLHKVKVSISTGGISFQKFFSSQWGKLNHSLLLCGKSFKKSEKTPELSNTNNWNNSVVAETYSDNIWQNKNSLTADMSKAAKKMSMFNFSSDEKVIFTNRYQRLEATGKVIWKNGGWINEQIWVKIGPTLGQGVLSLEPPTFASSADWNKLSEEVVNKMNSSSSSDSNMDNTKGISRTILYPNSYANQTVDFSDSKLISLIKSGNPKFYWNYDESNNYYVYAKLPVKLNIHAVKSTTIGGLPIPSKTEANFECANATLSVKRNVDSSSWVSPELEIGSNFRSDCKTSEGKTPDEIMKSSGGLLNGLGDIKNDSSKSDQDKAKDILKNLGF